MICYQPERPAQPLIPCTSVVRICTRLFSHAGVIPRHRRLAPPDGARRCRPPRRNGHETGTVRSHSLHCKWSRNGRPPTTPKPWLGRGPGLPRAVSSWCRFTVGGPAGTRTVPRRRPPCGVAQTVHGAAAALRGPGIRRHPHGVEWSTRPAPRSYHPLPQRGGRQRRSALRRHRRPPRHGETYAGTVERCDWPAFLHARAVRAADP